MPNNNFTTTLKKERRAISFIFTICFVLHRMNNAFTVAL